MFQRKITQNDLAKDYSNFGVSATDCFWFFTIRTNRRHYVLLGGGAFISVAGLPIQSKSLEKFNKTTRRPCMAKILYILQFLNVYQGYLLENFPRTNYPFPPVHKVFVLSWNLWFSRYVECCWFESAVYLSQCRFWNILSKAELWSIPFLYM